MRHRKTEEQCHQDDHIPNIGSGNLEEHSLWLLAREETLRKTRFCISYNLLDTMVIIQHKNFY